MDKKIPKFYSLEEILKKSPKAKYYMIFGERSNGKSHSVLEYMLKDYLETGNEGAIIRRYEADFLNNNGQKMVEGLYDNIYRGNIVDQLSNGKWNYILFYRRDFYLCRLEDSVIIAKDTMPFITTFYLNSAEHKKGGAYPRVHTILFDEFISNNYLINEIKLFTSILSTIVRLEDYARVFLCGNSISPYCPYFADFGINARTMKKGTIDVYKYGDSGLEVAVEYADFPENKKNGKFKKKSDIYFAFKDNPALNMITNGDWELNLYPHLFHDYHVWDIFYKFFIINDNEIFQCDCVDVNESYKNDKLPTFPFIFIHRKTTPVKEENELIDNKNGYFIYKKQYDPRPYRERNLIKPVSRVGKWIARMFAEDKVCYQDNMVGESIRNYCEWCSKM